MKVLRVVFGVAVSMCLSITTFTGSAVATEPPAVAADGPVTEPLMVGAAAEVDPAFAYAPLTPARLMDTRPGKSTVDTQYAATGAFSGSRSIKVTGRGGVPVSGVDAVTVNITVVGPASAGYSTVHPTGTARPTASNINFAAGQTIANTVIAKVGTGGSITVHNSSAAHILIDVNGWSPVDSDLAPLVPARLMDTRPGSSTVDGLARGQGEIGSFRTLKVTGRGGVPVSGVAAVVINITVTSSRSGGHLTVHPWGSQAPTASNLNFGAGQTIANLAIAKVGFSGEIVIRNSAAAHVLIDVAGWYATGSAQTAVDPARLMDTRPGKSTVDGQMSGGGSFAGARNVKVVGRGGVPATGVGSVTLNVTVSGPAGAGYSTVYPTGAALPNASNINYGSGATIANLVVAKVGAGGSVAIHNSVGAHVIVDVAGWSPAGAGPAPGSTVDVSAGGAHSCAVAETGELRCWGQNDVGQLGDGTTTSRSTPVQVVGLSDVTAVSAGARHTCALTGAGGVKCWGTTYDGRLGIGSPDGTVQATPRDVVGLATGVVSIAAGDDHTCAVTSGGALKCWGNDGFGQLGDGPTQFRDQSTPVDVVGMTSGVSEVATGWVHTCARTTAGAVKCWGFNGRGALGDGTLFLTEIPVGVIGLSSGATSVTVGSSHSCATTTTGSTRCWGWLEHGQLGIGVTEPTGYRNTPVTVTSLSSGSSSVVSHDRHSCVRTTTAALKCWGLNNSGELGDSGVASRNTPVDVTRLRSGVVSVDPGGQHTCALKNTGNVVCWGTNFSGQLGDGTTTPRPRPVPVDGL